MYNNKFHYILPFHYIAFQVFCLENYQPKQWQKASGIVKLRRNFKKMEYVKSGHFLLKRKGILLGPMTMPWNLQTKFVVILYIHILAPETAKPKVHFPLRLLIAKDVFGNLKINVRKEGHFCFQKGIHATYKSIYQKYYPDYSINFFFFER